MSKAMWGVLIIFLSIITIGIVNIVQSYTSGKEADYYLLKETSEAAMLDSVDIGYYRMTGHIKIDNLLKAL